MQRLTSSFSKIFLAASIAALGGCGDGSGNPEGIGNHCEVDDDCPTGECYLGPGGGYCTAPCTEEGTVDDCPEDTVCKPIQGGPERCLLICGSESACEGHDDCGMEHCPDGSGCVDIANTEAMACEPDP